MNKKSIYLSCGNSTVTDIPDNSVDAVITDPPFFDNVHYAELADFFYVWQQLYFEDKTFLTDSTTRHPNEVQDADVNAFVQKLSAVFKECHRVLSQDGLMIFSYHHSRSEGWLSVASAVLSSSFSFVQAQPVKAEMSVATPKSQASNPIDLDVFLVCKKQESDHRSHLKRAKAYEDACSIASSKIKRFNLLGRTLSKNDAKIVLFSQLLVELSPGRNSTQFCSDFEYLAINIQDSVIDLWKTQSNNKVENQPSNYQLALF